MRTSRYRIDGALPIPPAFAIAGEARLRMCVRERNAVDALLAHRASDDDISVIESLLEASVRAIKKARKLSYCSHLDPDHLDQCERAMYRAAHALRHAQSRHEATGTYGLDAQDRACIVAMDEWYGAMTERGAIPRAVWLMAYRDGATNNGRVVVPAWEKLL